jgi:hypothetical protein
VGYVPQADYDRAEQQRRSFQAERDRLAAENAALKQSVTPPAPAPAPAPAAGASLEDIFADPRFVQGLGQIVGATLNQRDALTAARQQAKTEFPSAAEDVLGGNFSTPEELLNAAKASHESVEAVRSAMRKEVEAEVFGSVKERYGIDVTPQVPPAEGSEGEKKITAADLQTMSMSEIMALDPKVREAALTGG